MMAVLMVGGSILGLLVVRGFMFDAAEEFAWRLFWHAIFEGQTISSKDWGDIFKSATFTKSGIGLFGGALLGYVAAVKLDSRKPGAKESVTRSQKEKTGPSGERTSEPADGFRPTESAPRTQETLGEAKEPTRHTAEGIPTGVDTPLPSESTNTLSAHIQQFAPSFPAETTPPHAKHTDIPRTLPKAASGTPTSLYLLVGIIVTGLLGYFGFAFYANKQELERMRVVNEAQERNAQQEAAARWAAEQQAEAERRARREGAAREAEAQRRAREAAVAEAQALRTAEQEAEARRKAQEIEAQKIAREQASVERKANLEIEAQRQFRNALAQLEKRYQSAQEYAKKRHAYGLARAASRVERIASADKVYHDKLARAQTSFADKRAQAEARYQDTLAKIVKAYGQEPSAQAQAAENVQTTTLQTNVSGDADLRPAAPFAAFGTKALPTEVADVPDVRVGDTYLVDSQYPKNAKLNNMTERKVVSVVDGRVTVASRNVKSRSGQSRMLRYTQEWNLVSSRNTDGSGLDYLPPLRYFEFPLYPGKSWRQTSRETNVKTGATRDFTLSATVGEWENISVPAGTFRAVKITIQTEIVDSVSGQRSTGTDVSWYAPDICRSVKSVITSRNMQGDVEDQFIHVAQYQVNR